MDLTMLSGDLQHDFPSLKPAHALVETARTFIANDTVEFRLSGTFFGHLRLRGC